MISWTDKMEAMSGLDVLNVMTSAPVPRLNAKLANAPMFFFRTLCTHL